MGVAFVIGVGHFEMLDDALGKTPTTVPAQFKFRLHPPDHDGIQLGAIRLGRPSEALTVEQLQQSRKTFRIAVVGRGGQKQLVLEMRGQRADGQRAQRVCGYLPRPDGATLWASSTINRS